MTTEHFDKYQQLANLLGWDALRALVPLSTDMVRRWLAHGDEHLNTLGNAPWDRASLGPKHKAADCAACGQKLPKARTSRTDWPYADLRRTAKDMALPWHKARQLSLAERNCVLKHVATVDALEGRVDR